MLEPGTRVVIRTPDRREYRGTLVEYGGDTERPTAVVQLHSGWLTRYPASMVHADGYPPDAPSTPPTA